MLRDYIELPLPVRILCLGSLVNRAGSFVLIFLTIYASEQLGFGIGFATACMGVLGLGSMCGALIGGHLADQIGRRIVMLIALIGGGLLLLVLGSLENRWAFMATVGIFALVSDMYRPAASAMIADHVDASRRPHAFALMYISINLGFAIAPPLGGFLAEFSFRWLFVGDAVTMFLYGLIILASVSESRPDSVNNHVDGHGDADSRSHLATPLRDVIARITSDTPFLLLCMATLLISLVFMQGMSTLPICIRQQGFSNVQFGFLMSVNGFLIFLLQLPMTHWLRRFNAMSVIVCGSILISIGFGLNAFQGGLAFLALTISIWTLGEILEAPFIHSIVSDLAPVDLRARYLGVFNLCYASAMTLGAPLGGEVLRRFGPQALWSGTFVVAIIAALMYLAIHRTVTQRVAVAVSGTESTPSTVQVASSQQRRPRGQTNQGDRRETADRYT